MRFTSDRARTRSYQNVCFPHLIWLLKRVYLILWIEWQDTHVWTILLSDSFVCSVILTAHTCDQLQLIMYVSV